MAIANRRDEKKAYEMINSLAFGGKCPLEDDKKKQVVDEFLKQRNHIDYFYAINKYNISSTSNGLINGTNEISKIRV